jgi:hypothetical protein
LAFELGEGLHSPWKNDHIMKYFIGTLTWTRYLEQPEGYKTNLKFRTSDVHVFTGHVTQDSCKRINEVRLN